MSNKTSIDELFRHNMADAQEQLNLGAWSNMASMLDGNNPYQKNDEDDNKKPFPWLRTLSIIALLLIAGGIGQWLFTNKQAAHAPAPITKVTSTPASNTSDNNSSSNTASNLPQDQAATIVDQNTINNDTKPTPYELQAYNNNTTSNKNTKPHYLPASNNITIATNTQQGNDAQADPIETNTTAQNNVAIINNKKKNNIVNGNINLEPNANTSDVNNNSSIAKETKATAVAKQIIQQDDEIKQQKTANINNSELKANTVAIDNADNKASLQKNNLTQNNKGEDSINKIVVHNSYTKKDGKTIARADTTSVSKIAITTDKKVDIINEEPQAITPEQSNPRLANNLSNTQQAAASAKPSNTQKRKAASNNGTDNNSTPNTASTAQNTKASSTTNNASNNAHSPSIVNNSKRIATSEKAKKPIDYNTSIKNKMMAIIENARQTGILKLGVREIKVDPAVFAGINGTFFDTKNDFGGFQMGINFMMKIRKNISINPGLSLFYRNNGGYSIRDTTVDIANRVGPIALGIFQQISYQNTTTTLTRNFKNMYSIELPLQIHYHMRSINMYAGANFAYWFKFNTQNIYRTYTTNDTFTAPISNTLSFPNNTLYTYKEPDFKARFGIGYIAGITYQMTNRIFVDLKYVKNFIDNSTTPSSKVISTNTFKGGSLQATIGYRLKDLTK
jgi:hypothetical protein